MLAQRRHELIVRQMGYVRPVAMELRRRIGGDDEKGRHSFTQTAQLPGERERHQASEAVTEESEGSAREIERGHELFQERLHPRVRLLAETGFSPRKIHRHNLHPLGQRPRPHPIPGGTGTAEREAEETKLWHGKGCSMPDSRPQRLPSTHRREKSWTRVRLKKKEGSTPCPYHLP
jgi:hypothetical protein